MVLVEQCSKLCTYIHKGLTVEKKLVCKTLIAIFCAVCFTTLALYVTRDCKIGSKKFFLTRTISC
jgi:hypothetical protein